jgi:hypothetical protein
MKIEFMLPVDQTNLQAMRFALNEREGNLDTTNFTGEQAIVLEKIRAGRALTKIREFDLLRKWRRSPIICGVLVKRC